MKGAFTDAQGRSHRPLRAGRRAARCSSTRSATCRRGSRPSCCACWRPASSSAVGASRARQVDVRVISATNVDLARRGRGGTIPRGSALPAQHHRDPPAAAARAARGHRRRWPSISCGATPRATASRSRASSPRRSRRSMAHPWPGNVRELEHIIERAVLMATATSIRAGRSGPARRARGRAAAGGPAARGGRSAADPQGARAPRRQRQPGRQGAGAEPERPLPPAPASWPLRPGPSPGGHESRVFTRRAPGRTSGGAGRLLAALDRRPSAAGATHLFAVRAGSLDRRRRAAAGAGHPPAADHLQPARGAARGRLLDPRAGRRLRTTRSVWRCWR